MPVLMFIPHRCDLNVPVSTVVSPTDAFAHRWLDSKYVKPIYRIKFGPFPIVILDETAEKKPEDFAMVFTGSNEQQN